MSHMEKFLALNQYPGKLALNQYGNFCHSLNKSVQLELF